MKTIGGILAIKGSLIAVAVLAYMYHEDLKRLDYTLFHENQEVSDRYFQDPAGLTIYAKPNEEGGLETHMQHIASGAEIEVLRDLLPHTDTMVHGLEQRYRVNFDRGENYADDWIRLARMDLEDGMTPDELEALWKELLPLYKEVKSQR